MCDSEACRHTLKENTHTCSFAMQVTSFIAFGIAFASLRKSTPKSKALCQRTCMRFTCVSINTMFKRRGVDPPAPGTSSLASKLHSLWRTVAGRLRFNVPDGERKHVKDLQDITVYLRPTHSDLKVYTYIYISKYVKV